VKLQIDLEQTEDLKRKSKGLEDQLREAAAGRRDTAGKKDGGAKCLVLGDSIIKKAETEHMIVQCLPGIRTDQLKRSVENIRIRNPDTVLILVGTNYLRRKKHLDFVIGEVTTWCTRQKPSPRNRNQY
jgi:hypothetical protein